MWQTPKNELSYVIPQNHGIHHLPWYFPGRQEKAQTEPVAVAALPAEGARLHPDFPWVCSRMFKVMWLIFTMGTSALGNMFANIR